MDVVYRITSIIIAFIIFTIIITAWLWLSAFNGDPYYLVTWWNRRIKYECDKQDAHSMNGIPSYQNAWECSSRTATELHRLIQLNHDDILNEVQDAIQHHYNNNLIIDHGDLDQHKWLKNEDKWQPIWVRFMGEWAGSAYKLPTLKRIISLFPDVPTLNVSVFNPGTTIVQHRSPYRTFYRYHYGLKVPYGDVGLKIAGYDVKWEEKEGFIWDDTLPHCAWNHTSQPRIVIFADIFRELSAINYTGSQIIYSILQQSKPVSHIKSRLQQNHHSH